MEVLTEFAKAAVYLPEGLKDAVLMLPDSITSSVQEIRLRADAPVSLSLPDGNGWSACRKSGFAG